ncbi:MAG TPA: hypothetical protein VKE95_09020 [Burkholderiales bacterium]|nr:hypothetical protein [Burkholderiales bacterium]
MKRAICVALLTFAALQGTAYGEEEWKFSLTPYLWLPNINGTLKYSIPPGAAAGPEVDTGPNNYLENLSFALMLAGEARKGKWSVFTDLIYLDFDSEKSAVKAVNFGGDRISTSLNSSTKSSLTGVAWTFGGGYNVVQDPKHSLDLLGGARYFGLKASSDWQLGAAVNGPNSQTFAASGSISQREDIWDAIVGLRGRVKFGEGGAWFVPYYLDIGAGTSKLTGQSLLGVGYAFKWGELVGTYRYVLYDMKDDKLLQDIRFAGPAIGATFRF